MHCDILIPCFCREWQMERSFKTSMAIHRPEVVFILGTESLFWYAFVIKIMFLYFQILAAWSASLKFLEGSH